MTDNNDCCRLFRKFSIVFILIWLLGAMPVLGDFDDESAPREGVAPVLVKADGVGPASDGADSAAKMDTDATSAESQGNFVSKDGSDLADSTSQDRAGEVGEDIWNQEFYGYPLWMILAVAGGVVLLLILLIASSGKGSKGRGESKVEGQDGGQEEEAVDEITDSGLGDGDDPPIVMGGGGADAVPEEKTKVEVVLLPPSDAEELAGGTTDSVEPVELTATEVTFELGNGVNGTVTCRTMPEPDEEIVALLLFGEGGSSGVYPVSKMATRIGRGVDNDLSLNNDSVSRHHAEILCKGDGSFSITDLDSGNGVFVNGQETTQKALQSGDKVEIGEVTLIFMPSA